MWCFSVDNLWVGWQYPIQIWELADTWTDGGAIRWWQGQRSSLLPRTDRHLLMKKWLASRTRGRRAHEGKI